MNQGKESQILELLCAWRHVAVLHSREQWRLFFEKGKFDGRAMTRTGYEVVGTSFGQMIRQQSVGILGSFISRMTSLIVFFTSSFLRSARNVAICPPPPGTRQAAETSEISRCCAFDFP